MIALAQTVLDLEAALSRLAPRLTDAENLDLTCRLLAARRAAGMTARLAGPSGRMEPLRTREEIRARDRLLDRMQAHLDSIPIKEAAEDLGVRRLVVLPGGLDTAAQFAAATDPARAATAEELEILADLGVPSFGDGAA